MTDFPSSPETASAKIEKHLWDAIDLMAATLEKPDPRVWAMLDIYRPSDLAQTPAVTGAGSNVRELLARAETYLNINSPDGRGSALLVMELADALRAVSDTSTDRTSK